MNAAAETEQAVALSARSVSHHEVTLIVQRVLAGKTNEFAEIVRRYQAKIFGMALAYTRNTEAAGDLVQDIFLATYESLPRYDQARSFTNWILKIATHHCYKFLRRDRRPQHSEEPQNNLPDPLETALQKERSERVLAVFHLLNEEMKMVVWLYYFFDRKCEQIAEILEISTSLVKVRLFRARQTMGKALESEVQDTQDHEI
ncbi:MAG: sigma-70 family RNA polymerase sigma factor [Candidatus Ozemobacteraceae bacterium]